MAAAHRGRWLWAGLFGGLTALTRPPRLGRLALRGVALLQVPAAFGLFCAFAARLTGDPLAWLHAQEQWGYSLGNNPWVELMRISDALEKLGPYDYFFADPLAFYYLLHGMVALGFVVLLPLVFRRCGPALGAYAALSLAVPLTGNALEGIGRYAATLFPVFMLLGTSTSRRTHESLLIAGSLGLALLGALFVTLHEVY